MQKSERQIATGDHEGTIATYDQLAAINPHDQVTYFNRGSSKLKLGRYEAAIADLDKAI